VAGLVVARHQRRAEQRGEIALVDLNPDRARLGRGYIAGSFARSSTSATLKVKLPAGPAPVGKAASLR